MTHRPAPDHLPPALVKTLPGGLGEFLRVLKDRSIPIDSVGGGCLLGSKNPSFVLVKGVRVCVGVTLPRTVTSPSLPWLSPAQLGTSGSIEARSPPAAATVLGANQNARGTAVPRVTTEVGAGGGVTLPVCPGEGFPAHSSAGLTFAWPEEGMGGCVCVTVCSRVPCALVSHQDLPAPAPNPSLLPAGVRDGPTLGGLGSFATGFFLCVGCSCLLMSQGRVANLDDPKQPPRCYTQQHPEEPSRLYSLWVEGAGSCWGEGGL